MEIRELLTSYKFPGDKIPIIPGSPNLGSITRMIRPPGLQMFLDLMDAVDAYIPDPLRAIDKPFLMPVEDVFTITGRGTVATGRIEAGIVNVRTRSKSWASRTRQEEVVTGRRDVPEALDRGHGGR